MYGIESSGNYSSFGVFTKWSECYSIGCEFHILNILFDLIILIILFIFGYVIYKEIKSKLNKEE